MWGSSNGQWNSIDDVMDTFRSLSKLSKGTVPDYSGSENSPARCISTSSGSLNGLYSGTMEEVPRSNNISANIGMGRGMMLRELEEKYSRHQKDEKIHSDLREIVGVGYSNAYIEQHWGSPSKEMFEDSVEENEKSAPSINEFEEEDNGNFVNTETPIEFITGASDILERSKLNQEPCKPLVLPTKEVKRRRCRNIILLNFAERNEQLKENDKQDKPELKGPDVFLPSKSYSSALGATKSESLKDMPLFSDEDFPAL